jgi:predicted nuclease of restriction endonuclease-like (RecB) superfamily
MKGFSRRNLHYMRAFATAYPDRASMEQAAINIPWGHTMRLLDAVRDPDVREWYARQAIAHGWSRAILTHQVESNLYGRQGRAPTNFERTLPPAQSDLAREVLKDPYNFDFLTLGENAQERDLERGLLGHIQSFLLELGVGFAFVGSQYRLEVRGRDYHIDLLFYHVRLHCYVVVDLKMVEFDPAFAGTMNFYLSAVDDLLRTPGDGPSIGIILCKSKDRVMVEYALRDVTKPIGVSEFRLLEALPADWRGSLPTVEELEATLDDVDGD